MTVDPKFNHREMLALSERLEQLYAVRNFGGLMQASLDLLRPLFAADYWGVSLNDPTRRAVVSLGWPRQVPYEKFTEADQRLAHHSPLFQYWVRTRDHDRVLRRTDCCDEAAFRQSALYCEIIHPLRFERQIGTWLRPGNGHHFEVGMFRTGRADFSPRDVARLALLRRHILRAYVNVLDREELIRRACGAPSLGEFPEGAFEGHLTCISQGLDGPARSPRAAGNQRLTPRETEILTWIVEGKTNPEIATILGTSWRTVRKQVESILRKLNVETRTAAAIRAMEMGLNRNPA